MFFWRQFSHALLLVRPLEVMKISHNRVRAWDLVWRSWFLHRPVRSKDMASCKKSRLTRWKTTRWTEWTACYLTWMTWSLECFFLSKFFTSMFSYWHFDEDMTRKLMWSRTRRKRNCRNKALIARALLKLGQAWHGMAAWCIKSLGSTRIEWYKLCPSSHSSGVLGKAATRLKGSRHISDLKPWRKYNSQSAGFDGWMRLSTP